MGRDLFGETPDPLPYGGEPPAQKHSQTSKDAAARIKKATGPMHRKILAFLGHMGRYGATDEEMQKKLEIGANTQRPRRRELQLQNLIKDSGRTRLTVTNREAVVWVLESEVAE